MKAKQMMSSLWVACLGALLVRGFLFWLVEPRLEGGDASSYIQAAENLLREGTFSHDATAPFAPSAYRPPLYSGYLAALLALSGHAVLGARVLQAVLSIINVVLVASLASVFMPKARVLAMWLAALNPFDAVYAVIPLSESITATLMLAMVLVLSWGRGQRLGFWALGGSLLGVLCLARDIYLALIPFGALAWVVFGPRDVLWRARLRQVGLVAGISVLTIAPWTLRNATHFHRFIPVSAGRLGLSLWFGSWAVTGADVLEPAPGTPGAGHRYPPKAYHSEDEANEIDVARVSSDSEPFFRKLFIERVKSEPLQVLGRWVMRAPLLWLGTRFDIFELNQAVFPRGSKQWVALKAALYALNAVLTLLGVAGAVWAVRRREAVAWLLVPLVFTALIYFPLNGFENRYSMPVYDLLVLFAAVAVAAWRARVASPEPQLARPSA